MKDVLVWDTETTGLILHPDAALALQPHIVEFGCVRLSGKTGKIIDKTEILIDPGVPIPPEVTKIHGITDDDVKGKPSFAEVWPKIAAEFDVCKIAIAHNAPFDDAMLALEFRRLGTPKAAKSLCKSICTIGLYREEFGYDPKLTDIYERVTGKKFDQRHRAAGDVAALVEIVQAGKLWRLS